MSKPLILAERIGIMTIEEFADIIGTNIIVTRRGPNWVGSFPHAKESNLWYAGFEGCWSIKEDCFLKSMSGNGKDPADAIANLAEEIRGECIVMDAMSGTERREHNVPLTLTRS